MTLFGKFLKQHLEVFALMEGMGADVDRAAQICSRSIHSGGKLIFCGNGGSAADSQHIAAELVGRLVDDRPALPALSLTTDTSALTCIANDYGYDQVFSRQLAGIGRNGDVFIGISTSGNSINIVNAVKVAQSMGIYSIGLLGKCGGELGGKVDVPLIIPSDITARIQEAHIFIGHTLCAMIEKKLNYGYWD